MENKVEDVERVGLLAAGKNELIKHLEGNRLTQKQAINAKCYRERPTLAACRLDGFVMLFY